MNSCLAEVVVCHPQLCGSGCLFLYMVVCAALASPDSARAQNPSSKFPSRWHLLCLGPVVSQWCMWSSAPLHCSCGALGSLIIRRTSFFTLSWISAASVSKGFLAAHACWWFLMASFVLHSQQSSSLSNKHDPLWILCVLYYNKAYGRSEAWAGNWVWSLGDWMCQVGIWESVRHGSAAPLERLQLQPGCAAQLRYLFASLEAEPLWPIAGCLLVTVHWVPQRGAELTVSSC